MTASHDSGAVRLSAPWRQLKAIVDGLIVLASSTRVLVEGESMLPALANQDRVLVSRLAFRLSAPRRGDIVLLRDPARHGFECIKRIWALPGDIIRREGTEASVQDQPNIGSRELGGLVQLGPDEFFVLGDNRAHSTDSRSYGPVRRSMLLGRAWYRYRSAAGWTGRLRRPEK